MKVHIYIGIPGCGKTTFARQYQAQNLGVVIIERDIIRETLKPGYYLNKPDKNFEKIVSEEQSRLIKQAIDNDEVQEIIISDTNLDPRRLKKLKRFIQLCGKVQIEEKIFWDSADILLCARRNRNRQKRVPEDVMTKFWRKFVDLYCGRRTSSLPDIAQGKQLIFVGDIHSQIDKLSSLVVSTDFDREYLIFLGDINDSRTGEDFTTYPFLRTYEFIRTLVDSQLATLIHSNHQKNLVNALRGRRKKANYGLGCTLNELYNKKLISVNYIDEDEGTIESIQSTDEALDMAIWFDSRPYYFKHSQGGYQVVGVHAQYLPNECTSPYNVTGKGLEALLYGTKDASKDAGRYDRHYWWEEYEDGETFVIAGHYHEFYVGPYCAVIDSGCGQGGPLATFNYDTKEVRLFGVS